MAHTRTVLIAAAMALGLAGSGQAHQIKTKTLSILHPWVHAAEAGTSSTDGFVVIKNISREPERLLGAALDGAGEAVLSQLSPGTPGGACKLTKGLEIAPGAALELKPGKAGLLFGKVGKTLMQDLYVDGVLHFAKAGDVKIEFFIESAEAKTSTDLVLADCATPQAVQ
jgi:periplasmic copper chaperone A